MIIVAACTSAPPAPEPTVTPLPVTPRPARGARPPSPTPVGPGGPVSGVSTVSAVSASTRGPTVLDGARNVGDATVRVLLSSGTPVVRIGSRGGVMLTNADGSLIARIPREETWRVEHEGRRIRAVRADGVVTVWAQSPMLARAMGAALLNIAGKPYRGDAAMYGRDSGVLIVNVVRIDDYLRGVVPLEIGTRALPDSAAVQAQAITARSYAFTHLLSDPSRLYDVTGGVQDQVYGGVAAETDVSSQAVESTRTLVLKYAGRVVNAPYSSTCGGSTAAASEVWRANDEPYLQRVSDRIPGTIDRYYCDQAPRFRWTKTLDARTVNAALAQYLAAYSNVPGRNPGTARDVIIGSRTPSGRVGTLTISTDRGNFVVRGNDTRYVLRAPGGEILNSTYFSVESIPAADGSLARLIIHGMGYGHGIGMCQSGAIGRARAGQDFRTILNTYYPGTTVGPAQ
jgi:stage II sporulation protein D